MAALAGVGAMEALDRPGVQWTGLVTAVLGVVATFATQSAMGASWRIGVDEHEKTDLVRTGPFEVVRNPIFTAMAITGVGLALMAPTAVALIGVILLLAALELQVRVVEEPYLARVHGTAYAAYAARVGRFVPMVGRSTTAAAVEAVTR